MAGGRCRETDKLKARTDGPKIFGRRVCNAESYQHGLDAIAGAFTSCFRATIRAQLMRRFEIVSAVLVHDNTPISVSKYDPARPFGFALSVGTAQMSELPIYQSTLRGRRIHIWSNWTLLTSPLSTFRPNRRLSAIQSAVLLGSHLTSA